MAWAEIREVVLPKLYDTLMAAAMIFAICLLGTGAVVIPLLIFKGMSKFVC